MEQCCSNHPSEAAEHRCAVCGRGFCIDCLTIVDRKPVCQVCAWRPRMPSEREAIASLLVGSIAAAAAIGLYTGGFIAIVHAIWG